jgi:aspartyl-tRNA(Asn)/glutamyl-tRNA(Gln) amidotransferase subunit C
MTVSKEDIDKVAHLARLDLSQEELVKYTSELDKILTYVQRLNAANTDGVEPLIHNATSSTTAQRKDIVAESEELDLFRETFLGIAPKTEGRFFKVPKMGK